MTIARLGLFLAALIQASVAAAAPTVPYNTGFDVLKLPDGTRVASAAEWETKAKPRIFEFFEKNVYGHLPPKPAKLAFRLVESSDDALSGLAKRRQYRIESTDACGTHAFDVLVYLPKDAKGPVPVFVCPNFYGNHAVVDDPAVLIPRGKVYHGKTATEETRGTKAERVAVREVLSRGMAVATFCHCELYVDYGVNRPAPDESVWRIFAPERRGPALALTAWAWGNMRVLDLLETLPEVDATRAAVVGQSRLAKVSVITAAFDSRFALCCPNDGGCKTLSLVPNLMFPHWFAPGLRQWTEIGKSALSSAETSKLRGEKPPLPYDQCSLIGCIAPRALYLGASSKDVYAPPDLHFAAVKDSAPVWALYGKTNVPDDARMLDPEPFFGDISWHCKPGPHSITRVDWIHYADFAARLFGTVSAVRPIEVSVRQTAGGPHLYVDGKAVRPRAFYGAKPSVAFIAETTEYDFTLPFTANHTTDRSTLRISFNPNLSTYWLHDMRVEDADGRVTPLDGWKVAGDTNACTLVRTDGVLKLTRTSAKDFHLTSTNALPLVAGCKYRFKLAIRANQGRQFFNPVCWQVNPANRSMLPCPLSYGDTFADTVALAGEAGVDIVTGQSGGYEWLPEGEEKVRRRKAADENIRRIIAANPKVLYIPRISADAPAWYLAKHPEIRNAYDNGFVANNSSLSDPQYRRDACAYVEEVTRHLRRTFPRNFAGVHFCGQNSGEWFYQNAFNAPLGGYEPCTRDAFRRWLRDRGDPDWATAEVPSADARRDVRDGYILHPVKDRRLVDFAVFRQENVATFLSDLGAAVNRGSDGKVLKLTFYGYLWEIASPVNGPSSTGHFALEWLMKNARGNIDALSAPFSYSNRKWPGSTPVMCPAETLLRNGIFWFNEDDTRTYLEDIWDYKAVAGGKPVTKAETIDLLTKNAALEIVRGFGDWWMDLFGRGWYRDADLWKIRRRLESLDDAFLAREKPYEPEIAYVMDEQGMLYLKPRSKRAMGPLVQRKFFDSCGAPYGQYLLNDILDNPPANTKLFFMGFVYRLTKEQRTKLAAFRRARPDATFVWVWAPGYVTEDGLSTEALTELTGIRLDPVELHSPMARTTELGLAKGLGHSEWGGALGMDIRPLFSPRVEPGDEVWSVYKEAPERAALISRPRADGTGRDIFQGPAQLFGELVRACADAAGVHCYVKRDTANVAAAEGYVFIQATVDGPLEVDFGTTGEVRDFLTGESLGNGPKLTVRFRKGEARVFKIPPPSR